MENTDTSYCTNLSFTGDLLKVVNGRLTYGSRSRTKLWSFTDDQVQGVDQVMVADS